MPRRGALPSVAEVSTVIPRSSILPLSAVAVIAAAALLIPWWGVSLSVQVTRRAMNAGLALPATAYLSDVFLSLLAVGTVVALAVTLRGSPRRRILSIAAAGGVVIAYATSEMVKVALMQARPCTRWTALTACDATGYSFPSNHSVLAMGAVWVIAVAVHRAWATWTAVAAALIVLSGRLFEGAHYLHDVAAGTLIGLAVPALLTAIAVAATREPRSAGVSPASALSRSPRGPEPARDARPRE
jgi:membrane-associated phospholipid phosphatase